MRRGHGSTKVPGVKLRPAAPAERSASSTKHSKETTCDDFDSQEALTTSAKPFKGLTLCASAVTDKSTLLQHAIQLGARTSSDLTDRVTHLICEAPGSQKYMYCITHGIPVMKSSWIHESHEKWINGEVLSMESSVHEHRFPTFQTVRLCVTAIDDIKRRTKIQKLVEANGGTYVETIGKGVQFTHLVCGPDRGEKADERGFTAKMKFVEKTNRLDGNVHLVWEEWFWDCLEFKGLLSEANYSASLPRPQRKAARDSSPLLEPISSTAAPRQESLATAVPSSENGLTASADVEVVSLKHVPEATVRLWGGLLRTRGFSVQNGKLSRDPSKITATIVKNEASHTPVQHAGSAENADFAPKTRSSLNAAFRRSKSMAMKSEASESSSFALQQLRSGLASSISTSRGNEGNYNSARSPSAKEDPQLPDGERNLFSGLKFKTLGDADGPKLIEAIQLRGGIVCTDIESQVDFIIVRLASGRDIFRLTQSENERQKFRTECWVEQCIFEERICGANEHLAFVPLSLADNVLGSGKLRLHISGLLPHEKTPTARLIKAIGATLTDQLSRRNTHLLCPGGSGPKFDKAQEWGIPVVNLQWLYDTVKAGEVQSPSSYLVALSTDQGISPSGGITDITNCEFIQGCSRDRTSQKTQKPVAVDAAPNENSYPDTMEASTWNPNGLLSETVEEATSTGLSPRKMSALSLSSRPSTPVKVQAEKEEFKPPASLLIDSPLKSCVPSSTTPSPLKIPTRQEIMVSSPSTLSSETQVNSLKDALTTLLGKRQTSDDSEGCQSDKHSKRYKAPPRSKSKREPSSRTTSSGDISRQATMTNYPLPILDSKLPSLKAEDEDESMRVTYEDPSQQKEKRRLLSMINNEPIFESDPVQEAQEAQEPRKGRNLVRRATRR